MALEITPRNDGEGTIGLTDKKWDSVFTDKFNDEDVSPLQKTIYSNFSGNSLRKEISFENMGVNDVIFARAYPTSDTSGQLGDVWVRIVSDSVYVYNSGDYTGQMALSIVYK